MIQCPQCRQAMMSVSVRANPGQLIMLDQCGKCGGIWCDKWELFPVDPDEAERIDPLDTTLLTDPTILTDAQLFCPRCTAALQKLSDPSLPKDIQLQRCSRCDGIWLNRGQFRRYKEYQRQARATRMGPEGLLKKLPAIYQDPKSWVVTGTQGMFAYPQGTPESDDVVRKSLSGAAKVVLESLLRLVIGI